MQFGSQARQLVPERKVPSTHEAHNVEDPAWQVRQGELQAGGAGKADDGVVDAEFEDVSDKK